MQLLLTSELLKQCNRPHAHLHGAVNGGDRRDALKVCRHPFELGRERDAVGAAGRVELDLGGACMGVRAYPNGPAWACMGPQGAAWARMGHAWRRMGAALQKF